MCRADIVPFAFQILDNPACLSGNHVSVSLHWPRGSSRRQSFGCQQLSYARWDESRCVQIKTTIISEELAPLVRQGFVLDPRRWLAKLNFHIMEWSDQADGHILAVVCWGCLHGVLWDNMCPYRRKDVVELLLLRGLPSACQQQLQEMPLHGKESNIWLAGNKTVASADHTNVMVANCQEACCQLIFSQTILQKILLCLCQ